MRITPTLSAIALAAFLAAPAVNAAEDNLKISNPTQQVDTANVEDIAQIVREINGQDVQIREANGKKGITFKDGDIPYTIVPVFCDVVPGRCLGFVMVVIVDNTELKYSLDTLNTANKTTSLLTFFKEENNRFVVGRVTLVDGGVTKKHIAINISLCALEFRETMKRLQNQVTVSLDGGSPFQRASFSSARLRTYAPTPDFAASRAAAFAPDYARRFGHR